jgi:hypothetical protein
MVVAGEWEALENGRRWNGKRWRIVVAGEWEALENFRAPAPFSAPSLPGGTKKGGT